MATQNIYLDNAGAGAGSIGDPYGAFSEINWTTGGANSIFDWVAAGDDVVINLAKGATWRETLTVGASGVSGRPITIQAYGSGADPIINGADIFNSFAQSAGSEISDNFDDNDITDWTSNGGNIAVGSQIVTAIVENGGSDYIYLTGTARDEYYAFGQFRVSSTITWSNTNSIQSIISIASGTGQRLSIDFRNDNGSPIFAYRYGDDTETLTGVTATAAAFDTWHNIVLHWKRATGVGNNDGVVQIWANGTEILNLSNIDNDTHTSNGLKVGNGNSSAGVVAATVDVDNVQLGTSWCDITSYKDAMSTQPRAIYEDDVALTSASRFDTLTAGSWWWDSVNNLIYIRATADADPATKTIEGSQRLYCARGLAKDYITIDGITFEKAKNIAVLLTGSSTIVQNSTFQHLRSDNGVGLGGTGIQWQDGSNHSVISCTFEDVEWGIVPYLDAAVTSDSDLIQSNTFTTIGYDAIDPGIGAGASYTNFIIEKNRINDCGQWGPLGFGITITGSTGSGNIVRYNLVTGCGTLSNPGEGIGVQGGASNITFHNNLVYGNYGTGILIEAGSGNLFYNNTVYNNSLATSSAGELNLSTSTQDNIIKNNIFYATAGQNIVQVAANSTTNETFDYNLFYGGSATPFTWSGTAYNFADWKTNSSQDANSQNADPLFTNAAGGDFTLQAGSPVIKHGVNLGSTYEDALDPSSTWPSGVVTKSQRSLWEIGAYVFGSGRDSRKEKKLINSGIF